MPQDDDTLPDIKLPKRRRRHLYTIHVASIVPAIVLNAKMGVVSVLSMPRRRGTALDWFRHTLYNYS